jgi:hypothetical protein
MCVRRLSFPRGLVAVLTSAAFWLLATGDSYSATLSSSVSAEGKVVIKLSGEISAGDSQALTRLIKQANDAGRVVSGIRLSSPGGSVGEGAALADVVRFARIATVVANGSTCASACFLVFAAGLEKYVSRSAQVGVHGAANEYGEQTPDASAATIGMASISKKLGVPDSIIGKMVVTPPNQMVWLTEVDLVSMGTTMTGKPSQVRSGGQATTAGNRGFSISQGQTTPQTTWTDFVAAAVSLSAPQNGGKADTSRACQPELKLCNTAVFFKGTDGDSVMVRVTNDVDGRLVGRDVCFFNEFSDVRTCMDWDSGEKIREMRDGNNTWVRVD